MRLEDERERDVREFTRPDQGPAISQSPSVATLPQSVDRPVGCPGRDPDEESRDCDRYEREKQVSMVARSYSLGRPSAIGARRCSGREQPTALSTG